MSQVVGLPNNSYKPIINTAWVPARLCKLQKGCTRLASASDKVYQLFAHGRWFSPGTPVSSTTKTGRHDILLKMALNTKNQIKIKSLFNVEQVTTVPSLNQMDQLLPIEPRAGVIYPRLFKYTQTTLLVVVTTYSFLFSPLTFHWVFNQGNTTGATCGTCTAYLSGAPQFTPGFCEVRVARS